MSEELTASPATPPSRTRKFGRHVFAAAILLRVPMDAALLGTLVGIDMLIAGAALVAIGTGLKPRA